MNGIDIVFILLLMTITFFLTAAVIYIIAGKSHKKASRTAEMNYGGKIEGMILRKISGAPVAGVQVMLGELTVKDGTHKFLKEKEVKAVTDVNGKYRFYGLKVKNYWVYVEAEGKKIVRMVKLTEEKPEENDVLITL